MRAVVVGAGTGAGAGIADVVVVGIVVEDAAEVGVVVAGHAAAGNAIVGAVGAVVHTRLGLDFVVAAVGDTDSHEAAP